jgi:hypothetical protein
MSELHDPQPGQLWSTPTGRTVEIVARQEISTDGEWDEANRVDAVAYHFVGGSMIHLRSVEDLRLWRKMQPE